MIILRCITIAIVIIIIQSCASEKFNLNYKGQYPISGYIVNNLEGIKIVADNAIEIFDGAIVSLRSHNLTQFSANFTLNLKAGKGLRFAIRTVYDKYPKEPAIIFDYTTDGTIIKYNGKIVKEYKNLKAKYQEPVKIVFENDGDLSKIKVDCDIVFLAKTKLAATEHIIIEALDDTYARLYGIDFEYILFVDPLTRTAEEIVVEPIYLE